MNQTFIYRKHLRAPFISFIRIIMLLFLEIGIMTFGILFTNHQKMNRYEPFVLGIVIMLVVLIMFLFVLLEVGIFYLLLFKRFKAINITLTDDAIVYNNTKKQIIIPYEDIQKLTFPSIKYTGGWLKIAYKGGSIRLTVGLEHIGNFIYELKEKVDDRGIEQVYKEKKLFSFFKTAVFADESWERVYYGYKFQLVMSYICIIVTIVMIWCFNNSSYNAFYIYGSLVAPLLGYIISEIIIGIKVKKRIKIGELRLSPRNAELEQKVFKICLMGFSIGYLLLLLVIMVI